MKFGLHNGDTGSFTRCYKNIEVKGNDEQVSCLLFSALATLARLSSSLALVWGYLWPSHLM